MFTVYFQLIKVKYTPSQWKTSYDLTQVLYKLKWKMWCYFVSHEKTLNKYKLWNKDLPSIRNITVNTIRMRTMAFHSMSEKCLFRFCVSRCINNTTVVKELRSKMLGQHPGYFKAVFLKKTQIIIVSIYEYAVYIMFWIMMLYDSYYY
jgi:hypothetical protein